MFDGVYSKRRCLITGHTGFKGSWLGFWLSRLGAELCGVSLPVEKPAHFHLLENDGKSFFCDIRERESLQKIFDSFQPEIVFHLAAQPLVRLSYKEPAETFDVNVMGTVYFTKAVIDQMIEDGYGRIINVASVAGVYGNRKATHYSATKGALISFTKALAKEVTGLGVTVNAVSPGSVSPAEQADIDYTQPSTLSFAGRTGSCRENADLICFLASEKAGYISGQNIQIDGCRKKQ